MERQPDDRNDFGRADTSSDAGYVPEGHSDTAAEAHEAMDSEANGMHDAFNRVVDYVRQNGVDALDEVTRYARTHPAQALIGAAVIGFIAGRMVRRS